MKPARTWKRPPRSELEHLKRMRNLLSSPSRWAQQTYAMDAEGFEVSYTSPTACSFCLLGAMHRTLTADGYGSTLAWRVRRSLGTNAGGVYLIAAWNDQFGRTHSDVLELLDTCIAAQERKQR